MTDNASDQPLQFFVDRSLGRHKVPSLLRVEGIQLHTLAEVYGIPADESVSDVEWLGLAGTQRWPVLMKDERVRYRPAERLALIEHNVQAFCLTSGNLRAQQMAEEFLLVLDDIATACAAHSPCLYAVSKGRLRRIDLD